MRQSQEHPQSANSRSRKRDRAYQFLKQLLLEGELQPGVALDVNAIASELAMSRTPVLEAISLLEREGFLSVVPQVGVFVRITPSEETYQRMLARAALEGVLAARAAQRIDERTLAELQSLLEQMDEQSSDSLTYGALNRDFHRLIHQAAGLPVIRDLIDQLWDTLEYTGYSKQLFTSRQASQREHKAIFAALCAHDPHRARALMEQHVLRVAELFAPTESQTYPKPTSLQLTRQTRRPE
uniref:GntR family transcriptional regulator n=1 Tax=Thermogemmatispora argillosa TaxID=2045280 RepID=A0A455SUU2_9CHLR|nr:GntR family transcriptional regulator [Thermogemmatispora argillosa]